ncbi:hypothetical protein TanjilG_26338 [Lupinus angustifolius]|uniref:Uncharacterized protein n=1 Tax=Lupinus angustifolius TaxID=3871 RepID=A0A4P1R3F3_LUPAN|nr:hypothetical protein TanjilG_26338 [Lupinus angustifolius]
MTSCDNTKKLKVEDISEDIDPHLLLSIEKLQEIQDNLEKINEEANDKVLEVEQKYNVIRKPVYDNRNEIIKSIPDFWLTALGESVRELKMTSCDNTKKLKVEDISEDIDPHLLLSIEKLQEIQDNLEKINEEANDKVLEVEQKYNVIRKPVYDNRNEIIKSIPDFWLTAFLSHPALGELLNDEDQKIFKYLDSLEVEDNKDIKSGYAITLNFKPNPYFEDTKLTKTYTFLDEGATKITATPIKWKEGKSIANGVDHEKKGNKRAFVDVSPSVTFHYKFQIADLIKEDLWPNPLTYFNNEVPDDVEPIGEPFEDDDENDSEDDDNEEEDE